MSEPIESARDALTAMFVAFRPTNASKANYEPTARRKAESLLANLEADPTAKAALTAYLRAEAAASVRAALREAVQQATPPERGSDQYRAGWGMGIGDALIAIDRAILDAATEPRASDSPEKTT